MLRLVSRLAAAVLAASAMGAPAFGAARAKPNIVLIVADDHGAEAIGAYGNPVIRTPALDALARDGVRFTRAYATAASCSPSRATLLTGQQNHANGMYGLQQTVHHFSVFEGVSSLPQALSRVGYRTARIGKFHIAPEAVFRFDADLGGVRRAERGGLGRSPVEMAEFSRDFIAGEAPFFLYFATQDPHREAPHEVVNSFGNRPDGYKGAPPVAYDAKSVIVPPYLPDTPATRAELAAYYQSISRVDAGVGRLIEILKETGKFDSTLIVYLSDNGAPFPGSKATVYEPGIRLPLIVRPPGGGGARVAQAPVSWVDIAPTLLDYAGAPASPPEGQDRDAHGRSFRALLEGGAYTPRSAVFASQTFHEIQMYYPMRAVIEDRYKLIWNLAYQLPVRQAVDLKGSWTWMQFQKLGQRRYGAREAERLLQRPEFELYDLQRDPTESRNLARDPAARSVLERLRARLTGFQDATRDPWSPNAVGQGG